MAGETKQQALEEVKLTLDLTGRKLDSLGLEPGFSNGRLTVGAVVAGELFEQLGAIKDDVLCSINGREITDKIHAIRPAFEARTDVLEVVVLRDRSQEAANRRDGVVAADLGVNMAVQFGRPRCEKCASCGTRVVEDLGFFRHHCVECDMTDW